MPPQSLSAAPLSSPWPVPAALAWDQAWEEAWPQIISACPPKVCPDCQPHTDLLQGTGALPSALDCALTSSSLVLHQPGASGPHVRRIGRKELLIGWWKKGWGLRWAWPPTWPHGAGWGLLLKAERDSGWFPGLAFRSSVLETLTLPPLASVPGPLSTQECVPCRQLVLSWPVPGYGVTLPHPAHCTYTQRFHLFPGLSLRDSLPRVPWQPLARRAGRLDLPLASGLCTDTISHKVTRIVTSKDKSTK